jgi:hypothetical protein
MPTNKDYIIISEYIEKALYHVEAQEETMITDMKEVSQKRFIANQGATSKDFQIYQS